MAERITSFKDLKTWQAAQDLAVTVYSVTKAFPDDERFGLTNQLRRAAVSIGSNIAEGFSRQGTREKRQFYYVAKGSLTEVESQLDLACRIGYLEQPHLDNIAEDMQAVGKMLTSLIRTIPNS